VQIGTLRPPFEGYHPGRLVLYQPVSSVSQLCILDGALSLVCVKLDWKVTRMLQPLFVRPRHHLENATAGPPGALRETPSFSRLCQVVPEAGRGEGCETCTTDLTEGESGGNNRVVYMGKHSALYIHERTRQPQEKTQITNRET
jgi:hypothetical protein